MPNIEFDTDQTQAQYRSRSVLGQPQVPSMAAWFMKKGIIKDESKARSVLVGIVIFNFLLMGFLLYYFVF
jgi:hypothetical protein